MSIMRLLSDNLNPKENMQVVKPSDSPRDAPELAIEFLDNPHHESQLWAGALRTFIIDTFLESGSSTNVAAKLWTLATTDTGSSGDRVRNSISPQWHHVVACVRAFVIDTMRPSFQGASSAEQAAKLWTTASIDASPSGDEARQRIEHLADVRIRITDAARARQP